MTDHEHRIRTEVRRGYRLDCERLCVAHYFQETRLVCRRRRRCGWATEWTEEESRCVQSLTMDSPLWDKLRRRGVLYR